MRLAQYGTIPKEWEHSPELKDVIGKTVAMYFADNGIIPPKEW